MKICLIVLKTRQSNYERYWREHLGIGYIGAVLKQNGYEVNVIDGWLNRYSLEQVIERMGQLDYGLIGISVYHKVIDTLRLVNYIKKRNPNIHITLGGHYVTCSVENLLTERSKFDSICMGEGEKAILALADRINANEEWKDVSGVAYMENGRIYKNPMADLIEDLDSLPFPIRDVKRKVTTLSISASRGCYGKCTFCDVNAFYMKQKGQKVRVRSARNIADEMESLVKDYDIKYLEFVDDNFLGNTPERRQWAFDLADEINRRGLDIKFIIECRVNDVDEEIIKRLKKAGLYRVFMGVESFISRNLKLYNKKVGPDENFKAISILKKYGIGVTIGYMLYDPDVTIPEIRTSLEALYDIAYWEFFRDEQVPLSLLGPLRLIADTPIYEYFSRKNVILPSIGSEDDGDQYIYTDRRAHLFKNLIDTDWVPDMKKIFMGLIKYFDNGDETEQANDIKERSIKTLKETSKIDLELHLELVKYFEQDISTIPEEALVVVNSYKNKLNDCYETYVGALGVY